VCWTCKGNYVVGAFQKTISLKRQVKRTVSELIVYDVAQRQ